MEQSFHLLSKNYDRDLIDRERFLKFVGENLEKTRIDYLKFVEEGLKKEETPSFPLNNKMFWINFFIGLILVKIVVNFKNRRFYLYAQGLLVTSFWCLAPV
ncbi:MAG: hypothetical protein Athens101410_245 [Parcubacteria group bacterium Athens1014_10]|nr:MAG: hypothetical protein Athens101410_245 [Parcubacteria group bacterium Athens1014_10]TSD05519.1 MAG: hypothetical protein Athens071412_329 [Parcubacteria group bacterium Athens0714_12]